MLSLLPPVIVLLAALAWAGLTFKKQSETRTEINRLQSTASSLTVLRARNADLREKQTLPQEIERLRRENAQLPEAQTELQTLTQRKAALEKELADKKDALEQEHISALLNQNRALSEGLEQVPEAPEPEPQDAPPLRPQPRGL